MYACMHVVSRREICDCGPAFRFHHGHLHMLHVSHATEVVTSTYARATRTHACHAVPTTQCNTPRRTVGRGMRACERGGDAASRGLVYIVPGLEIYWLHPAEMGHARRTVPWVAHILPYLPTHLHTLHYLSIHIV